MFPQTKHKANRNCNVAGSTLKVTGSNTALYARKRKMSI